MGDVWAEEGVFYGESLAVALISRLVDLILNLLCKCVRLGIHPLVFVVLGAKNGVKRVLCLLCSR